MNNGLVDLFLHPIKTIRSSISCVLDGVLWLGRKVEFLYINSSANEIDPDERSQKQSINKVNNYVIPKLNAYQDFHTKSFTLGNKISNLEKLVFETSNNSKILAKLKVQPEEFIIGNEMNHRLFAKTYSFSIDEDKGLSILMEKVVGRSIANILEDPNKTQRLNKKEVLHALKDLKSGLLYLFEKKIVMRDVNDGNLFFTNNGLKIIDFEFWEFEENEEFRTKLLLLGAMEVTMWLIKASVLRKNEKKNKALEYSIGYPKSFFHDKQLNQQIVTCFYYSGTPYEKNISSEFMNDFNIDQLNTSERKKLLENYLNQVSESVNQSFIDFEE